MKLCIKKVFKKNVYQTCNENLNSKYFEVALGLGLPLLHFASCSHPLLSTIGVVDLHDSFSLLERPFTTVAHKYHSKNC